METKKIHVLQVTGTMNRGGAEVMLMDIYRNISKDIHFDFLVNYNLKKGISKGDFDDEIIALGGRIEYIPAQWDTGLPKYISAFKKVLKEIGKPDIVHIHLSSKSGVIAMAARRAGIKNVIIHSHADLKFRGSLISRVLASAELVFQKLLIASFADYYWGCSIEANNSLFYKYLQTKNRPVVINNAVDVNVFQKVSQADVIALCESYGGTKDTLILGNIGRVVGHKNVAFILDILKELSNRNIDFRFVFAGRADQPAYLEEIFNKAEAYGIAEKIIYLDVRDDIQNIVSTFDVFVGPALKEGFGLVAVEAQATGTPCVLYTGFPKSVDMQLGLVTFLDNFDVRQWTESILKTRNSKCRDKKLIWDKITAMGFDIRSNTRNIEKLYKKYGAE